MTLHGEPQVWLEQFPLGKPASFRQEHLGLVYQGEVVRVDRWSPRLAGPLAGDVYFRIILMKIVRASDLSALSNTLDIELVEFIRRVID